MNKLHEILRDPQCATSIRCLCFGISFTMFWVCLFVGFFAWFDYAGSERNFSDRVKKLEDNQEGVSLKIKESVKGLENKIMPSALKGRK